MKEIIINAECWRNRDDLYVALLPAIGAPSWHGRNLDALNDSLSGGDINEITLPFHVRIRNTSLLPAALISYLQRLNELVDDLQNAGDREICLTLE